MISPLAYVEEGAKIGKNVTIQPFAYIEKDVEIGDGCVIMAYASVLNGTRMGKNNKIYHHAVLGAEPQDFKFEGNPSRLIIGDNNNIRENVVISRSSSSEGATIIGNDNFLMDMVHLCHDVQIGNHCVVGISTTIAGECILDDCVILSGNVILHQHCHVASWTLVQSGCRISKDVPPYVIMSANPAAYHGVNSMILAKQCQMPENILRHIISAYRLIYQGHFSLEDAMLRIEEEIPMSPEIEHILEFIKHSKGIVK